MPDNGLPTFGPDNNLISSEVLPSADPRLLAYQDSLDQITNKVLNGPNRYDLAKQYYDNFTQATQPSYDRAITDATNAGAAHGRIGSGILTNTYGDLAEKRLNDEAVQKRAFLTDALEGTIGDTQNAFSDIAGAERNIFGEGANLRNETRTERDYQRNLAEQALLNRIQQQVMSGQATQQDFNNALTEFNAGNINNPTGVLETSAGQAGDTAATDATDVEALIKALLARQAQNAAVPAAATA